AHTWDLDRVCRRAPTDPVAESVHADRFGPLVWLSASCPQREVHRHGHHHPHRLPVEEGGRVAPLAYGVDSRLVEFRDRPEDFQIRDRAVGFDHGLENHDSADAGLARRFRVDRIDVVDLVRLLDDAANTERGTLLVSVRSWRWGR